MPFNPTALSTQLYAEAIYLYLANNDILPEVEKQTLLSQFLEFLLREEYHSNYTHISENDFSEKDLDQLQVSWLVEKTKKNANFYQLFLDDINSPNFLITLGQKIDNIIVENDKKEGDKINELCVLILI